MSVRRCSWQAEPVTARVPATELEDRVEVKIGVLHTPREIVLESNQTPAEVEEVVATALKSVDGQLALSDERGRRVIVPANLVAYIEIAQADVRRVGFVAG
jgi:Protein of unknown function (DUF3107)